MQMHEIDNITKSDPVDNVAKRTAQHQPLGHRAGGAVLHEDIEGAEIDLGPGNTRRPDEVRVDYAVIDPATGKAVYDPTLIVFANEAGQVFDRIARSDMDGMIEGAS